MKWFVFAIIDRLSEGILRGNFVIVIIVLDFERRVTVDSGRQVERSIHEEVVVGIVQVLRYLSTKSGADGGTILLERIVEVGCADKKHSDAQALVYYFILDGLICMKQEWMDKILDGDYSTLWEDVNHELDFLGYGAIEPVDICLQL